MRAAYVKLEDGTEVKVKFKQDGPGYRPKAKPGAVEIPTKYTVWYAEAWQRVIQMNTLTENYLFIKPNLKVRIVEK